jgi:glycosyltransferase involved in cell wall biosynthesis
MLKIASRPDVLILIPDDYLAGGIQRSALSLSTIFHVAGFKVRILATKLVLGGFASRGFPIVSISPDRKYRLMFWVEFVFRFRRMLIDHRGGLIIALGASPSVFLAMLSFRLNGVALIGSERVYPPFEKLSLAMRIARWLFYRRLDQIVVQSPVSAKWIRDSLRIPEGSISVIPNVVARPALENLPSQVCIPIINVAPPAIVFVGRLTEQKGCDYALEIFSLVKKVYPLVTMMIIGEGPLKPVLQQAAIDLGLVDSVLFIAPMPDLREIWGKASVFLLTSRYEGFPNVLAEAMAYGVPPVAFDCATGPSDLIRNGENGFLIEVGNVHAAANFVTQLLRDPKLRSLVGERAKGVTTKFSMEVVSRDWLVLAQSLLANCERR